MTYCIAAIAPWRASGNVTAPVSSLIIPNTYGLPVAFFADPNTEALEAVLDPDVALVLLPDDPLPLVLLLELLDPQPAARTAEAATAAAVPSHLECVI